MQHTDVLLYVCYRKILPKSSTGILRWWLQDLFSFLDSVSRACVLFDYEHVFHHGNHSNNEFHNGLYFVFRYSNAFLSDDDMLQEDLRETTSYDIPCICHRLHRNWLPYCMGLTWVGEPENSKLLLTSFMVGFDYHGPVCNSGSVTKFS